MVTSVDARDRIYLPRLVDRILPELLADLSAISLVGPRGAGKTTTALQYAVDVRRLNRSAEVAAFRADPYAMITTLHEPALLDEWQEVPEVLSAIKESIDSDPRPGRFLLTGSVRATEENTWPATGRIIRLPVYPLTRREICRRSTGDLFLDRLRDPSTSAFAPAEPGSTLLDYIDMAVEGGLPDPVMNRTGRGRAAWLRSYLDELTSSDIKLTGADPDRRKFTAYVKAVAASSGTIVEDVTLMDAARISRPTAVAYDDLLEAVYFSEKLPAWWSDRLTRLTALPKRFVLDTSLLLSSLNVSRQGVLSDSLVLGRVLETFVAMQLRPELAVAEETATMAHLREKAGRREIDFVIEYADSRIAAVEVKATSSPDLGDAKHLTWLRETLGERFVAGIVLHTGPYTLPLSESIWAAPISTLWA